MIDPFLITSGILGYLAYKLFLPKTRKQKKRAALKEHYEKKAMRKNPVCLGSHKLVCTIAEQFSANEHIDHPAMRKDFWRNERSRKIERIVNRAMGKGYRNRT